MLSRGWLFASALFLTAGMHLAVQSWEGWSWPVDITLAQAGAEIHGTLFIGLALICVAISRVEKLSEKES